ncbi:uncharacterized protein [Dysidea avara]|uniref:uncharacterized protein isoform X2 n=1 Tax=Dysidea avara TaxID=196820 RepID=UPI003325B951
MIHRTISQISIPQVRVQSIYDQTCMISIDIPIQCRQGRYLTFAVFLKDHEHGTVNIFNSPKVIVKNCTFQNNTSTSFFTRKQFQSNGGGLSIGYNERLATINYVDVLVNNCVFKNNSAIPPTKLSSTTTVVLAREVFSGRGGGLSILIKTSVPVNVVVNNSKFINNFASNYGGGLYQFINEEVGNQTYVFGNNTFINNTALRGAGAVNFGNFGHTINQTRFNGVFYNCIFDGNSADLAGGLHIFPSYHGYSNNYIRMELCKFNNNNASNYAGAVDIISYNYFGSRQHYDPFVFVNCEFNNNFGNRGGAVAILHYAAHFENVTFTNHRGPVILAVSSTLNFRGNVRFIGNNAFGFDGGALFLRSFSQMYLDAGTHFQFINNSGGLGASIVVENLNILPVFENSFFNSRCFLQYSNRFVPPNEWKQVSMKFVGNKAIVGSAMYANRLGLCSWYSYSPPYFDLGNMLRSPFVTYGDGNVNSGQVSSDSLNKSFSLQTPAYDFVIQNKSVSSYPGEVTQLTLLSYDEQNFPTSESYRISTGLSYQQISGISFEFSPSARTVRPIESTFSIQYNVKALGGVPSSILRTDHSIEVSSLRTQSSLVHYRVHNFNLTMRPCPPGHVLNEINATINATDEYKCICGNDNDGNIVECLPQESKIILEEDLWALYIDTGKVNGMLEYYHCPPGYCQCTKLNDSDVCTSVYDYDDRNSQCVCDREGYLCGRCRQPKGVSVLLNKCVTCGNENVLLIIGLVIVNIIIILVVLLLSLSLPSWLYPFLFYLQIAPYLAEYFPVTFRAVQPYLRYISSAASLYFPYDFCLYSGMTALASYTFRYIPFVLTIIISTILYTANRKFKVAKNLRLSWSGLWLLIMLLSTDVINTSVSILNCPILKDSNGNKHLRWYHDGTVKCFTGGHAPLAIIAIIVLTFGVLLCAFITCVILKVIKRHWAVSMSRKLVDSFASDCKWWSSVELSRRYLFIIFIMIAPGNLGPVLLLAMCTVMIYAFLQPYHCLSVNLMEVFTMVDILLLLMISSTEQFKDLQSHDDSSSTVYIDECGEVHRLSEQAKILIPFYYLPLVIFCMLLLVKLWRRFLGEKIQQMFQKRKNKRFDIGPTYEGTSLTLTSTSYLEFDDDQALLTYTTNHT